MAGRIGSNLVDDPTQNNFICSCGEEDWAVVESRKNGVGVRRRRRCRNCGAKVTSIEVLIGTNKTMPDLIKQLKTMRNQFKGLEAQCSLLASQIDFFLED